MHIGACCIFQEFQECPVRGKAIDDGLENKDHPMDGIHVQELICNNDIYTVCVCVCVCVCARVCLRVFLFLFIVKCTVCTKLDFWDSFPVFVDFATFSTNKPNKELFHGYFSFNHFQLQSNQTLYFISFQSESLWYAEAISCERRHVIFWLLKTFRMEI